MKAKWPTMFIVLCLFATACKSPKEKLQQKIQNLQLAMDTAFSKAKADSLQLLYAKYAKQFPKDTLSPLYSFRVGRINLALGNGKKAIAAFREFYTAYPNSKKHADALFLQAYTAESVFGNLAQARKGYQTFIDSFPNHPLTNDARASIENLGLSPTELINKFETAEDSSKKEM